MAAPAKPRHHGGADGGQRTGDGLDKLLQDIEARRDDLVALTQDLIRIPTLNPPGRHYHDICAFVGERMSKRG